MSKFCCVAQCPSKSGSTVNSRNLFGINKKYATYIKMLKAIGTNLKQSKVIPKHLFICDLHFEDRCIERTDIKLWKNGEEVIIPRKKARLKTGSLPTIFPATSEGNRQRRNEALRPIKNNQSACTQQVHPFESVQKNGVSVDKHLPSKDTSMQPKNQDLENNGRLTFPVAPQMVGPVQDSGQPTSSINNMDRPVKPTSSNQNYTSFDTPYTTEALMHDWKLSVNERKVHADWTLVYNKIFGVLLAYSGDIKGSVTRSVLVKNDMSVEIKYKEHIAQSPSIDKVSNFQQLLRLLLVITCSQVCEGIENQQFCPNIFYIRKPKTRCNRCSDCQILARKLRKREERRILREKKEKKIVRNLKQKYRQSIVKISQLADEVNDLMEKCSLAKEKFLEEQISGLPQNMQESIKTCYIYSKVKDKREIRYLNCWILECLLLRIKSRTAYQNIIDHKMLVVPSVQMLHCYIKQLKPSYGFNPAVFAMLKRKGEIMKPEERRGTLLVDEIKLNQTGLDKKYLNIIGYTDLRQYTLENQKNCRDDHALVFLFQPFRGSWVQSVGAFLNKGAVSGDILSQLITEGIILLENNGFFVDIVTSDGEAWDRRMWKKFGLEREDVNCLHPCSVDANEETSGKARQLWFCSDFSDRIKNLRNLIISQQGVLSPIDVVMLKPLPSAP